MPLRFDRFESLGLDEPANFVVGAVTPVYNVSAATTLTAAMSGSVIAFAIPAAAGAAYAITLPAVQAGLAYRVIAASGTPAVDAKNVTLTTPAAATIMQGYLINATTRVACANKATIVFTGFIGGPAIGTSIGDSVDLVCDGTNWHVRGFAQVLASLM